MSNPAIKNQGPPGQHCGNCKHFQVRNRDEALLARIAKPMSHCGPGQYCHGGAVRGTCSVYKQMVESTQWCAKWHAGGPVVKMAGSVNRGLQSAGGGVMGVLAATGLAVAGAALAGSELSKVFAKANRGGPRSFDDEVFSQADYEYDDNDDGGW